MKVFLDASFLIAARLQPGGDYNRVLGSTRDTFVSSEHVLDEVARNLRRLRRKPDEFIARLRSLLIITDRFDVLPVGVPLENSGDRQALGEALGSECELFVTSDPHFQSVFDEEIGGVTVISSGDYARQVLLG